MKTLQRVGALILVFAMLLPLSSVSVSASDPFDERLAECSIAVIEKLGAADFPTGVCRMDTLETVRDRYNATLKQLQRFPDGVFGILYGDLGYAEIDDKSDPGVARLIDSKNKFFITDVMGAYPYCYVAGDVPAEDIAVSNVHANKWCGLTERSKEVETVTHDALASAVIELNDAGIECSLVQGYYNEILYYFICTPDYKYYCNSKNEMFVAPAEASATDLNRPYVDDDGNPLDIEKVLDLENNILNLPGDNGLSLELSIGNISYDAGDKSYTVNAYTTINEGDEYYYTYYTYNIQYNITNTYITYIGSNEPYERKEYELYYQLPDGRSSADLTAEEVAGMSFEFYDVVNYARSAIDISVRGLYHFDGNLEDSSYFTAPDRFKWLDGASITYMESPSAFGGNLYLDNTAHSFEILLPNNITSSDFTIQFRYYQASEPDTQANIENSIFTDSSALLNDALVRWDEGTIYNKNGIALAALPVGTWNEIALVRHLGQLFYYLNGHCIGDVNDTNLRLNNLTFKLGDTSRAYSMIDELRVLNFAITEGGADYQPTNVPHDSNLVLVLPDSDRPSADEYFEVESSRVNLLGDTHNYLNGGNTGHFHPVSTNLYMTPGITGYSFPEFVYRNNGVYSVSAQPGSVYLARNTGVDPATSGLSDKTSIYWYYWGFGLRLAPTGSTGIVPGKTYTFSIVHEDGSVDSFTFVANSTYVKNGAYSKTSLTDITWGTKNFSWGSMRALGVSYARSGEMTFHYYPMVCIVLNAGAAIDVAYIELVEGDKTDIKLVKKTAVYKGTELEPNTAAIQTTIPVKGYTVGGVRPTMPAKGDLWFPVMENRITGVQIYAGTHWEEVNARWWTGSRWIPIYAFDINTLEDLFDIADGDGVVSLLPDTNSFFRWWQLQWLDFRAWLEDALANIGSGTGPGSGSDCQHVYSSEVSREPGCVEPGTTLYTCSNCGHQYTELIDAHGHDWITTDTVPDVLDENGTVIEKGYEILTCSVCDATAKDYGDGPEEDDLFDALGDLLAGGVEWLLDKLTQLADRLRLITDTFTEYIEKVKDFGGEYPAFFAAAFLLIPEELRILFWLAVVGVVVLAVWKKYSS